MTRDLLKIFVSINRVLTTINGFFFGILIQFSPIHSRKGKALRIPLPVNVVLLAALVVVLILLFRSFGLSHAEPASAVKFI
jgi:hypothetical protein